MGEFWDLTPRELAKTLEGAAWRTELERERDVALAWHIVALDRTKRLPPLRQLIKQPKPKKLTPAEKAARAAEFAELTDKLGPKQDK